MSIKVGELFINIIANNAEFKKALKDSSAATKEFAGGMKTAIGGVAAYLSATKLAGFIFDITKAYAEEEDALISLGAALRATNQYSKDNYNSLVKQGDAIAKATLLEDDQVYALEATALKFGVVTDKVGEYVRAAQGLAEITGQDVTAALQQMIKAHEGNFTQLQRNLPALVSMKTEQEKYAYVLQKANEGLLIHKERMEGAKGGMKELGQMITDSVLDPLGKIEVAGLKAWKAMLFPGIDDKLTKLYEKLGKTDEGIKNIQRLQSQGIFSGNLSGEVEKAKELVTQIKALEKQKKEIDDMITAPLNLGGGGAAGDGTGGGIGALSTEFKDAEDAADSLLARAKELYDNKVLISGNSAKITLQQIDDEKKAQKESNAAAIEDAKKMMEQIKKDRIESEQATYSELDNIAKTFNEGVYNNTVNAFTDMIMNVKGTWAEGFASLMENIKRQIVNLLISQAVQALIKLFLNAISGGGASVASSFIGPLPLMAKGGPVSSGRPYIVGDEGPELFVPRNSGNIIPNGAGGMTNNFYGPINTNADIDGMMRQAARRMSYAAQGA